MEFIKKIIGKIKAVAYCRVSSKEQEETGYSLTSQEKLMQEYADRREFEMKEMFSIAESASGAKQRKVFTEMMAYLEKNKINILLCEKVDRITRNFKEAIVINDWLEEDPDRQIHFVKQNLIIHKNAKSDERFRWDIEIVLAKKYVANLSEEVKKGQKEKISQGWLPTKPPLGYKTVGDKGHKIHAIDEKVAPYIKEMFTLYATGNYSTVSLGKKMYEEGFRSRAGFQVVKSKIHKLLSDPFYYGKFMWKGEIYQGKHEAIIAKDVFDQVKEKMTRGSYPYHNKHSKELRGKIFCGNCSKTVTWERQKGHWYGACKQCKAQLAKTRQYIRQEDVENELLASMVAIAPRNERIIEILKKALKESHSEEISYHETQVNGINSSLQRIQQRLKVMYEDKLDGRITADFYDDKVKGFTQERETLTEALKKLNSDNTEYYKIGFAIHELALKAKDIYLSEKASIEERRLLLAYAFESISVSKGIITPKYTKAFNFLATWMPRVNKNLEPAQKTSEILISQGDLYNSAPNFSLKLSEVQNDSRTSRKPSVKARHGHFVPISHSLLRG